MTATSNIHIGLAGWSNATYTVGQRRSNAGNAYQVTIPGPSTSPPTGTGGSINNGGVAVWRWLSAIDFSSIGGWVSFIPSTLTQPVIGLLWNDGVIAAAGGTQWLNLAGKTTSPTNTITLMPAVGEGFIDFYGLSPTTAWTYNNTHGVAVEFPVVLGNVNYLEIDVGNVIIRGLQLKDLNSTSAATIIGGSGQAWIDSCVIEGQTQTGGARIIQLNGSGTNKLTNSLILDHASSSVGDGTFECPIAGVAIANTTFVRFNALTGSRCLDASTNSATSSNTAQNCIFVGYDIPFGAVSGNPWLTNNNAYTNASFSVLNNGTDAGGSVFGATTTTLFVAATTDYHQNPTSPCLNAGVTDTTDIPAAIDVFGTSRPQGTNWDIGPHELLGGHTIQRDFVFAPAYLTTRQRDYIPQAEWKRTHVASRVSSIDWTSVTRASFATSAMPIEILRTIPTLDNPFSESFSTDFGWGGGTYVADPSFSVEWASGVPLINGDAVVSVEWGAVRIADSPGTAERKSSVLVDSRDVVELGKSLLRDLVIPTESLAVRLVDAAIPEQSGSLVGFSTSIAPAEWGMSAALSVTVPTEWLGFASTTRDVPVQIEWRTTIAINSPSTLAEWRTPRSLDFQASVDVLRTTQEDSTQPLDNKATMVVDGAILAEWRTPISTFSFVMPVELGSNIRTSATGGLEFGMAVLRDALAPLQELVNLSRDAVNWTDFGTRRITDAPSSVESGGGVAESSIVPEEWRGGILVDQVASVASGSGVQGDVVFRIENVCILSGSSSSVFVEWRRLLAVDSVVPIELSHLLLSVIRDDGMSAEHLQTVSSDAITPTNYLIGQQSIGSKLEPDAWECEHQPPEESS